MGSTSTNKRSVELQLMRKLSISRQLRDIKLPNQYQDEFVTLCSPCRISDSESTEEVGANSLNWRVKYEFANIATKVPLQGVNWRNCSGATDPPSYKLAHLDGDDAQLLKQVYEVMYPERDIELAHLAEGIQKFGAIKLSSVT